MIEVDAQIIGHLETWGRWFEWKGGHYAAVHSEELPTRRPKVGEVVAALGQKLRIVDRYYGLMSDKWIVARANDPIAEIKVITRQGSLAIVRVVYRVECAIFAFRLKLREGQELPFTRWLADKLL